MVWINREINEKQAFTEYKVSTPTTDFQITFEFVEAEQNLHVFLNGLPIQDTGRTFELVNGYTIRLSSPIEYGTIRISRETDIDENKYKFTAGALFEARTMDEDFEQIRDAQQELRDEVQWAISRMQIKDTILELTASTSFPEPDMAFGVYVAGRTFELFEFYPHIARCVSPAANNNQAYLYRNEELVGTIYIDNADSNRSHFDFHGQDKIIFRRGDRLILKLKTFNYSLSQVAVTLVGKFPLYDLV